MRTREEIMKEINYQQRRLKSAVNCKDKQSVLERQNIINGLSWCLGTDFLTEDERKYVDNDTAQTEILLLQVQLESANNTKKVLQTVLDAYKSAYQDLKTSYEELKSSIDKTYYATDKLNTHKDHSYIIVPRCNCKQLLNQLYGTNKMYRYYINGEGVHIGDVIKVYTDKNISETGLVKEININHLILIDDGGRDTVILFSGIKKLHNYNRKE